MLNRFSIFILCFGLLCCKSEPKKNTALQSVQAEQSVIKVNPSIKKDSILTDNLKLKDSSVKEKSSVTKAFVLGKFDYKKDSSFVIVSSQYSAKTIHLKKETYNAFLKMQEAAKQEGVNLKILSGTRNFYEQKRIWERKWNTYNSLEPKARALKILEYSSMPSTSRHHWGTDIDLNNLNNSYFNSGKGLQCYNWLVENANSFGFYQVYTDKANGRQGYNLEKWHWSYLPLANAYLKFYNKNVVNTDIEDFLGSELSETLNVKTNYVNGISKLAKNYK